MFINEVQSKVGLSKKSIRYYEEEGLLIPKRDIRNDYRIYTDDDIKILKKIKVLRELGVPVNDIKLLKEGKITLEECMLDRIKKIEQCEKDYKIIKNMCLELCSYTYEDIDFDVGKYLKEVNILNKRGFTMRNLKSNRPKKISGAVISSLVFSSFFVFLIITISYFQFSVGENMPWFMYIFLIMLLCIPVVSIVVNLIVRIREIMGGEEDEASKY